MRLGYLVHDLADPAVHRRVSLFHVGGAAVALFGFRRGPLAPPAVAGLKPTDLGRTADAALLRRIPTMLAAILRMGRWGSGLRGTDVIVARQLEMLVIAAIARRRYAPGARLVFECLDIHRTLVSTRWPGRLLRAVERALLRQCSAVVVSSPAFERAYLRRWHRTLPGILLVENKVLAAEVLPARQMASVGPPWRIGWFGMIRCRRSLLLLADLVAALPGQVEVVIRGRVASTAIPDFHAVLAAQPGLAWGGPYDRATDLAAIYGEVHFTWAIDLFEAGANSDWLLPNRLYEGGMAGAVPIALATVETGRWLARHGLGLLLAAPSADALQQALATMTPERYAALAARAVAAPRSLFVADEAEQRRLVTDLGGRPVSA